MSVELKFPTETIDLPSRGWFYPEGHPLSSGQVEISYMTAKHEDILTSTNLISKGIVIDKLIEALLVNPAVKIDDLLLGDKSAIMLASRILGYGKEYTVSTTCPECKSQQLQSVNLETIDDIKCPFFTPEHKGINRFTFELPLTKNTISFKFLTHSDDKKITKEIEELRKVTNSEITTFVTTRMKHSITSVEGDDDKATVRSFVENMPARDAMAFRKYLKEVTPDIDLDIPFRCSNCSYEGRVEMPIDVNFFWPNA